MPEQQFLNILYVAGMEAAATTRVYSRSQSTAKALLPVVDISSIRYCICKRCLYVNDRDNNFCTNCGYPVKEKESSPLYHVRMKQRKELLRKGEQAVQSARVILYVLGSFLLAGIGFLFGNLDSRFFLALCSVVFSSLFFLLAYWSYTRPFTALITAFILVLTFSIISVFGEFVNAFTTVVGVYGIFISLVLVYFLLKGVQGAYKAELVKEEMEIL